jgi:HD-GYP domain-containing protein (c-di-GMP phosphodiesterase class II)
MSEEKFTPIRVASLRGDIKTPFDVYIHVAGKYILYLRKGSSFEGVRLNRLKAKKLKKLYVRPEDEIPYRQYLEESIDKAYKAGPPLEVRAEVIQGFQQAAAEDFMEDPLNEFSYTHVRSSVQRFTEFLQREPDGVRAILTLQNIDHSITHHGVSVAALSIAMTLENELRTGHPLHLMALGCLLHDMEHYFSEFQLEKSLDQLTPKEKETYRLHPTQGAHRLQGAKFLDQLVLNIITQHEEHIDGSGFPKGLFERDMDPLVTISATANAYDRLVCFGGLAPREALKSLLIDKMGAFPLPMLQNLQAILKRHAIV